MNLASPSSAFVTPARRPRSASRGSRSSSRSHRNSSLLGSGVESELTPSGAQILHAGLRRSGRAIALQVLGVYRYVADPVLQRVLPPRARGDLHRDVFDLLLSDGQMKMKAILSPALNGLVWRGQLSELDVVEIDDYEIVNVDEATERSVCVIHELAPRAAAIASASGATSASSSSSASSLGSATRAKIVYSADSNALVSSPSLTGATIGAGVPELQFISQAHIREHGALPLAGGRLYYLSLLSDDYPSEWEPVQCERLTSIAQAVPWAEWNRRRRYCTDIFSSTDRVIHTIREANLITRKRSSSAMLQEEDSDRATPVAAPPMVGIVHFKSGLTHIGSQDTANDFPFMFQIVLSDRERSVEMAFFGSMAAKNFLIVQEGDVIQVHGYTVSRSEPRHADDKAKKLFVFPHLSTGVVSHVPDKYWHLLEMTGVLPIRAAPSADDDSARPSAESCVWLEPTFVTTLHAQQWDLSSREEVDATYFDFVGIVSFVGRVHRHRVPASSSSTPSSLLMVQAYRWIKVFDSSSTSEMVIRLYVNSQPTAFHAIQASDRVMLTKLQWIDARQENSGLEFATTSLFTTVRRNEDVEHFGLFPECSELFQFAESILGEGGDVKTQYSAVDSPLVATTESWLEGPGVAIFEPLYPMLPMADTVTLALTELGEATQSGSSAALEGDTKNHWIPSFYPRMSIAMTATTAGVGYNYPFDQVAQLGESMDAMSHRYIRVHVALHDIRVTPAATSSSTATTTTAKPCEIELLVSDGEDHDSSKPLVLQPIRVRPHLLFKESALPPPLDEFVAEDAEPLVCLLSPSAIKSLNTSAILRSTELPQFSPAKAAGSGSAGASPVKPLKPPAKPNDEALDGTDPMEITLEMVKEYIMKNRQAPGAGIDLALHLYRLPHGEVDLWVDGINL